MVDNKEALLDLLEEERATTLELLAEIDDDVLSGAEIRDGWTAKDMLAHLTVWEAELVTGLFRLDAKRPPRYYTLTDSEGDVLTRQFWLENRARALDRILEDFVGVRTQLLVQVERLTEKDLFSPTRYNWLRKNETLVNYILDESVVHEVDHRKDIEAWWRANRPTA